MPRPTPTLFPYTTLFRSALEEFLERLEVVHRLEAGQEALPAVGESFVHRAHAAERGIAAHVGHDLRAQHRAHRRRFAEGLVGVDRKSTRLNSSHPSISYAAPHTYPLSLHDALPICP